MTVDSAQSSPEAWKNALLQRHQLGAAYLGVAQQWFDPLAARIAAHHSGAGRPVLVGVNGCQGSGKTTLVDYLAQALAHEHGLRCATVSLDDFYLSRADRQALSRTVHPLLATRGVPGTHDMPLMHATLCRLLDPAPGELPIPRFDKSLDDRSATSEWASATLPLDVILFEGWCLGVTAQAPETLVAPANPLERDEDPDGAWRRYVNNSLDAEFPAIHALVDRWVMLRAPSFACVQRWRQEQEDKLRARLGPDVLAKTMDHAAIARFVQHYQRLTEVALSTLAGRVDELFELDEERRIVTGPPA